MSGFDELTRKQQDAIVALLSSRTIEEAARAAKVTARTLYRWMKDPDFIPAYREARFAIYSQAVALMHQFSGAAVTTLAKVMLDPTTPPGTKVRAADSMLNHTAKATETEDVEARVSELEKIADLAKPGWRKR